MPTIVVIDDEQSMIRSVQLSVPDCSIHGANDGIEGLDLLRELQGNVDLVLLDVKMGRMDGRRTLLRIRALYPKMPVRMISGDPTPVESLAMELTGKVPIEKPIDLPDLAKEIYGSIGQTPVSSLLDTSLFQLSNEVIADNEIRVRSIPPHTKPTLLLCGDRIVWNGLRTFLEPAGLNATFMHMMDVRNIELFVRSRNSSVVVTRHDDFEIALRSDFPVMCICANLDTALSVLDQLEDFNLVLERQNASQKVAAIIIDDQYHDIETPNPKILNYIRLAFQNLTAGRSYIPEQLLLPLSLDVEGRGITVTPEEARFIRCELLNKEAKDMAVSLNTSTNALRQMRYRIVKKIDKPVDEWPKWVADWWRGNYP